MIISFRDKRTRMFFEGERVKAFHGIERQAMLRLDRLESGGPPDGAEYAREPAGRAERGSQGPV
jgi:plasmid maintenance system killer protein